MHVVFLLPEYYNKPIGGYRVVFEYANRLAADGDDVTIIYPNFLFFWKSSIRRKCKMLFYFAYYMFNQRNIDRFWFCLNKQVRVKYIWYFRRSYIPKADLYVATAVDTAFYLNQWDDISSNSKYYFIQALEDWQWGVEFAIETWKYPLNKIVVSKWLQELMEKYGQRSQLIENGIDREGLFYFNPIEIRSPYRVAMLYHKQPLKGCDEGLEALRIVRSNYPELVVEWFGSFSQPKGLPDWIRYYQTPDVLTLNRIYNEASIYLAPSRSEGFGLTVGEAMNCGCAIVCTNAGGFLTMARHGQTALIVDVMDVEAMARSIIQLIESDRLRCELATNGLKNIQQFTWDLAYRRLKNTFEQSLI